MYGPSQMNSELATFFRHHVKTAKLSKEEFDHIESMIFSRHSPSKKALPLFPRATPLTAGRETPFSSRYSSVSSSVLKSSRKTLEVYDYDIEDSKSFLANHEKNMDDSNSKVFNLNESFNQNNNDMNEGPLYSTGELGKDSEISVSTNTHRQITDAAKELMASMLMSVDEEIETVQLPSKKDEIANLPTFAFKIPESDLPKFHFDISEHKPAQNFTGPPNQLEYSFNFDLSDYEKSSELSPSSNIKLPEFIFKID